MAYLFLTRQQTNAAETNNHRLPPKELLASKCLDPLEVTEIMKISIGTLSKLCRDGLLEVSKVGNRLYFDIDDLVKMLNDGKKRYRQERKEKKNTK